MNTRITPLAPVQLAWRCDPATLGFDTTKEVAPLENLVGQDRALGAIELGLEIDAQGYNLFVCGPSGSGRTTTVRQEGARVAAQRPAAPDWCYIHNFEVPYRPIAVRLSPGRGAEFARDMHEIVETSAHEIARALESEAYRRKRAEVVQTATVQHDALNTQVAEFAAGLGFSLQLVPNQILIVPVKASGEHMSPEEFEQLSPEQKTDFQSRNRQIQQQVDETFLSHRRVDREAQEALTALDREFAQQSVSHQFASLQTKYAASAAVAAYLQAVHADLVEHLDAFRELGSDSSAPTSDVQGNLETRYAVNVLVSNGPDGGAPIVFEPNPTYYNLVGRIDYRAGLGMGGTDLTLIKPGALHRANGGFLIIEARDLLLSPNAWEALKRALRDREVRIENQGDQLSPVPVNTLRPEPIPLAVKVILIGDLGTHVILSHLDEDFPTLFKVKAQFAPSMERTPEAVQAIARFISGEAARQGLLPFSAEAAARVVEHASRLAEDQERLATRFDSLGEVIVEASYWGTRDHADRVENRHVEAALSAKEHRLDLVENEIRRATVQGAINIDTAADVVGQVNGLSIMDLGDHAFGHPSKITASVGIGADGLVNIEREVDLSGPTHSKGVMILGGYLREKYAQKVPIALSASLAFEQTYFGVDGDSASAAELCALVSALAELPIHQGIAITGSVNQWGQIQAVGSVTRKIEGFFDICERHGLSGEQGVIIPSTNVRHLMLKSAVISAVADGRFKIWPVETVDEAIELLMEAPAGDAQPDGSYSPGSVHERARNRLVAMAEALALAGLHPAARLGAASPGAHRPLAS